MPVRRNSFSRNGLLSLSTFHLDLRKTSPSLNCVVGTFQINGIQKRLWKKVIAWSNLHLRILNKKKERKSKIRFHRERICFILVVIIISSLYHNPLITMRHLNNAWNSWYSCIIPIVLHVLLPCFSSYSVRAKVVFVLFIIVAGSRGYWIEFENVKEYFLRLEINLKQFGYFYYSLSSSIRRKKEN